MEETRDFKGIWFSKEIWLDTRLSALEKIILLEIDSLDTDKGCYATNEYLAKFCQCSTTKVSNAISKLVKLDYLYIEKFNGRDRVLRSNLTKIVRQTYKNCKADLQNLQESNIIENTNIEKENKTKENNVINVDVETLLDRIKNVYQQNNATMRFNRTATRRKLLTKSFSVNKLTPTQIVLAYKYYFYERSLSGHNSSGEDFKYIKQSDTFLTEKVFDYTEKSSELYKQTMNKQYGDDWEKLKFKLVERKGEK